MPQGLVGQRFGVRALQLIWDGGKRHQNAVADEPAVKEAARYAASIEPHGDLGGGTAACLTDIAQQPAACTIPSGFVNNRSAPAQDTGAVFDFGGR